jgi:hypothetical protein
VDAAELDRAVKPGEKPLAVVRRTSRTSRLVAVTAFAALVLLLGFLLDEAISLHRQQTDLGQAIHRLDHLTREQNADRAQRSHTIEAAIDEALTRFQRQLDSSRHRNETLRRKDLAALAQAIRQASSPDFPSRPRSSNRAGSGSQQTKRQPPGRKSQPPPERHPSAAPPTPSRSPQPRPSRPSPSPQPTPCTVRLPLLGCVIR